MITLLPLWRLRRGFLLLCLILPLSFGFGLTVAAIEERIFIYKYRETGVGPTPRWTVWNHWLAYDAETKELTGSD